MKDLSQYKIECSVCKGRGGESYWQEELINGSIQQRKFHMTCSTCKGKGTRISSIDFVDEYVEENYSDYQNLGYMLDIEEGIHTNTHYFKEEEVKVVFRFFSPARQGMKASIAYSILEE